MSCLNTGGGNSDSSFTDSSCNSDIKHGTSALLSAASKAFSKQRKVRFTLDDSQNGDSQNEAFTDADISTDMDESSLCLTKNSSASMATTTRFGSLSTLSTAAVLVSSPKFLSSPLGKRMHAQAAASAAAASLSNQSRAPIKKRRIEAVAVQRYPLFGDKVPISKFSCLLIISFLSNKDVYAVSLTSSLLNSAAMDKALWEEP